jgi:hypothetical protein
MNIRETQFTILQALGRYKYLTAGLTLDLLQRKCKSTIWKHYRELVALKLIGVKKFPIDPKCGQLEGVYYLTPKGRQFLLDHTDQDDEIKHPKGQHIFAQDYYHRLATIRFYIELDKAVAKAGGQVSKFVYYFDKTGSNRGGERRLESVAKLITSKGPVIPDGVAFYSDGKRDFMLLLEHQNGRNTKELIDKIKALSVVLIEGTASEKFNFPKSPRVLFVIDQKSLLEALQKRVEDLDHLKELKKFFLFKLFGDIKNGEILTSWEDWDGNKTNL